MQRSVNLPLYLLVSILFLLSLSPLASAASVAQPAPCPPGSVYAPEQDKCLLPDGSEPPTEEPVEAGDDQGDVETPEVETPEDEEDQTLEETEQDMKNLDAGNIFGIALRHYACDAGFDPRQDRSNQDVACTGAAKPAFTYTITLDGRLITSTTLQTGDGTRGEIQLDSNDAQQMPAGTLVVTVDRVDGWAPVWVTCTIKDYRGSRETVEPAINDYAVSVALDLGDFATCTWYNVASGTEDPGQGGDGEDGQDGVTDPPESTGVDITIAAYYCPDGTTATDDLVATCTERSSGLSFALLTETDTVATQTSDAEGDIFFPQVEPLSYGIAEDLPSGYGEPIVICYHARASGESTEGLQDIVFGNQFRITVAPGDSVECAWYNVPAQGSDTGPNIYIQARACGEGTTITSSTNVFDAENLCPVAYQDLEFRVLLNEQVIATDRTSSQSSSVGQAFFTKLPAPDGGGYYGVTASLNDDEQTLAVYCDLDFGDGVFQVVPAPITDGNRIDQVLYEGHTLRCSWFVEGTFAVVGTTVPEPDPTSAVEQARFDPGILIVAQLCPPEVETTNVQLADVCIAPGVGVTFDVSMGGEPSSTQASDENGQVDVPIGVGSDTYLINNRPNPGLSEPSVSCTITHPDGTAEEVGGAIPAGSPGIEIAFDGESQVVCTFYFLGQVEVEDAAGDGGAESEDPVADGETGGEGDEASTANTLTIQFWTCPDVIDPDAERSELTEICSPESVDRSVVLRIDGEVMEQTISGSEAWEFNDPTIVIDAGGSPNSSVWCSSTWDDEGGDATDVSDNIALNGSELTATVSHPATTVSCDWFTGP